MLHRLLCIHLFCAVVSTLTLSQIYAQGQSSSTYLQQLNTGEIIRILQISPQQSTQNLGSLIVEYKGKLLEAYQEKLVQVVAQLNTLRNPGYQYKVTIVAKQLEGINLYHNYTNVSGKENDDANTCVNGWCQVMAQTGQPQMKDLATGSIKFYEGTISKEQKKQKPNLRQAIPKYIHVSEVLKNAEKLGFLPIDLDLTQRGDFCVQYYRKVRERDEFMAQHISIVDMIVPWGNDSFELRDWNEGVEGEPFIYRTGTNRESSYNNVFLEQNVYYGYQEAQGKERQVFTKNPNICQGYGYFGNNLAQAKELIRQINYIRGQIYMLKNLENYVRH